MLDSVWQLCIYESVRSIESVPYEYLEDEAIADIAFRAWGKTLDELFMQSAEAVYSLLTDINKLERDKTVSIDLQAANIEKLLYQLLDEIIYLKDAELFFPCKMDIEVTKTEDGYKAKGKFVGTEFNYLVHHMGNDIKAITYHDFHVTQKSERWEAYVLVDI